MRDYKPRQSQSKRRAGGGTLLGVFVGLVLGLGIAAAVAVYMTNAPVPFVNKAKPASAPPAADRNLTETQKPAAAPAAKSGPPVAAAVPPEKDKPRFDFYKILPGQEEPVTDQQIRQAAKDQPKAGAPKDTYVIQVGAFQNPADADNLKAKLALLGLQASVEPATLPDKGTWYRVRLGPFAQLDEINRIRATLAQNNVDASLVKLKN